MSHQAHAVAGRIEGSFIDAEFLRAKAPLAEVRFTVSPEQWARWFASLGDTRTPVRRWIDAQLDAVLGPEVVT